MRLPPPEQPTSWMAINYLMIDEITDDQGVTNPTHEVIGILPGEASKLIKKGKI